MDRNRVTIGATLLGLIVLGWLLFRHGGPPQIGPDEDVSAAVDALFTAISVRDLKLIDDCERRLQEFTSSGNLPLEASDRLDEIIGSARSGEWKPAAEKLYDFMKGQRRGIQ